MMLEYVGVFLQHAQIVIIVLLEVVTILLNILVESLRDLWLGGFDPGAEPHLESRFNNITNLGDYMGFEERGLGQLRYELQGSRRVILASPRARLGATGWYDQLLEGLCNYSYNKCASVKIKICFSKESIDF